MNRGDGGWNGRRGRHLGRWLPAGGSVAFLWLVSLGCSSNNGSFLPGGPAESSPDGSTASVDGGAARDAALADAAQAADAGHAPDGGHPADAGSPGDAPSSAPDSGSAVGSTCMDGVQDGDETAPDCGGSCPPCVAYSIGSPNTDDKVGNACGGGGDVSFICPRFMLLSSEMREAAAADESANGWPAGAFNYGVATLNGAACCACYQIRVQRAAGRAARLRPAATAHHPELQHRRCPQRLRRLHGQGGGRAPTRRAARSSTRRIPPSESPTAAGSRRRPSRPAGRRRPGSNRRPASPR